MSQPCMEFCSHLFQFIKLNSLIWDENTVAVSVSRHQHCFNLTKRANGSVTKKTRENSSSRTRATAVETQVSSQAHRALQKGREISSISQARNLRPCNGTIAD